MRGYVLSAPNPRRKPTKNNDVASIIEAELAHLSKWAAANEMDAVKDKRNFWMLKIPAIIGGVGASALEAFNLAWAVIVAGFVTAICVAIDGLHPRGGLYNVHKRASNELLGLHERLVSEWNQLRLLNKDIIKEDESTEIREESANLLARIQKEKERISNYITAAEASLDVREQIK